MTLRAERLTSLVFDVDGTLYRQKALRRAMLLLLLREAVARPASSVTIFRALRAYRHAQELLRGAEVEGTLAAAQLRLASERAGQPEHILAPIVARWMEQEPLPLLDRFVDPALRTLLAEARSRGLRLGIFSDYPAVAKLAAMRLSEFFDVVVSAQDLAVNRFKPHPLGLLETLRRLGVDPAGALYVGDRHDVDASIARAAGVSCVIVGRRSDADVGAVTVSDYGQLHSMLFPSARPN
jgi:FMN phosphatase YigB (HAD superfamily)